MIRTHQNCGGTVKPLRLPCRDHPPCAGQGRCLEVAKFICMACQEVFAQRLRRPNKVTVNIDPQCSSVLREQWRKVGTPEKTYEQFLVNILRYHAGLERR